MENEKKKNNRRGVMIGAFVPLHFKEFLERRAKARFSTLSQVLKEILLAEMNRDQNDRREKS